MVFNSNFSTIESLKVNQRDAQGNIKSTISYSETDSVRLKYKRKDLPTFGLANIFQHRDFIDRADFEIIDIPADIFGLKGKYSG
jgi:hypothetical protein